MKFFYERTESEDEVKIVLKPHSFFIMLLMIAIWLINDLVLKSAPIAQFIMPIFIAFMVIRFFSIIRVQKEILLGMKQRKAETAGSKFSIKNPLTYTIKKH